MGRLDSMYLNPNDPSRGGSGLGWGGVNNAYNARLGLGAAPTADAVRAQGGMRLAARNWIADQGAGWSNANGYVPGAHGAAPATLGSIAKGGTGLGGYTDPAPPNPYVRGAGTPTVGGDGNSAGQYTPVPALGGGMNGGGNGGSRRGNPITPMPTTDATGATLPTGGATGTGGTVGYGVNVNDYLDPSMAFQMHEGMDALNNNAAARGTLDSGQSIKDALKYAMGLASTDYGNAFNRATNVRNFNYGVDTGDRDFAYRTQSDDYNRDYTRLRDLASMGMSGSSAAAGSDNSLALAIAALMQQAGGIQGSSYIGQSNNISSILSQILGY